MEVIMPQEVDVDFQQILSFMLGENEYAVDIFRVREILQWEPTTQVPNSPEYMKGVINRKGMIIPVIDLRMRFGQSEVEYKDTTVVMVLAIYTEGREKNVGFVVDAVIDVHTISKSDVEEMPNVQGHLGTNIFDGIITINENMIVQINVDSLVDIKGES